MKLYPPLSRRFFRVWQRNWTVYRQSWKISFIPPLLEPLFYLLAFGVGLSALVGNIRYGGMEISYVRFIAPALIAITVMNSSFFENTYASFVPDVLPEDLRRNDGDAAHRGGDHRRRDHLGGDQGGDRNGDHDGRDQFLRPDPLPGGAAPAAARLSGGLAFGAAGMICTSLVPNIELFNLPVFLFITPMFLFGGTFFPVENLPGWAQTTAALLPLTHLVDLSRAFTNGRIDAGLLPESATSPSSPR